MQKEIPVQSFTYRNYQIDYTDTNRQRVYVDGTLVLQGMTEEQCIAYAKAWIDREVDRRGRMASGRYSGLRANFVE
jgi:hypothetical protein